MSTNWKMQVKAARYAELQAEIARLRAALDKYGLALMMIREGGANPQQIARKALAGHK